MIVQAFENFAAVFSVCEGCFPTQVNNEDLSLRGGTYFAPLTVPFVSFEGVLKSPGELLGPDLLILETDGVAKLDFRFELPLECGVFGTNPSSLEPLLVHSAYDIEVEAIHSKDISIRCNCPRRSSNAVSLIGATSDVGLDFALPFQGILYILFECPYGLQVERRIIRAHLQTVGLPFVEQFLCGDRM